MLAVTRVRILAWRRTTYLNPFFARRMCLQEVDVDTTLLALEPSETRLKSVNEVGD